MKIVIDTHTHSLASGHAYSTVDDLARGAAAKGLSGFVLTDHGPALCGTHPYHFGNLRVIPTVLEGVRFYSGVEANIMDRHGALDLNPSTLARLDFVLAGFHEPCFDPGNLVGNTEALVAALANPYVDAISHPGNPAFPVDKRAVVEAAVRHGKALEINDGSFRIRHGSRPHCEELARLCAEAGAFVVVGSDAHYWRDVGNSATALEAIVAAGIPEERVLNASVERFEAFVAERTRARAAEVSKAS